MCWEINKKQKKQVKVSKHTVFKLKKELGQVLFFKKLFPLSKKLYFDLEIQIMVFDVNKNFRYFFFLK